MIKRLVFIPAFFLLGAITAFGQDPLKVAPEAYKLQFENEWVKVAAFITAQRR